MAGSMLSLQAKAQGQRAVPRRGSRCEEKKGTDLRTTTTGLSVLHRTERPFHIMRAVESTMAKLRAWVRTCCGKSGWTVRATMAKGGGGRRVEAASEESEESEDDEVGERGGGGRVARQDRVVESRDKGGRTWRKPSRLKVAISSLNMAWWVEESRPG